MVLRIEGESEEDVKTYIAENLSENGVFLKTVDKYPFGTKVELRFSLPNSPADLGRAENTAQILWTPCRLVRLCILWRPDLTRQALARGGQ